MVKIISDSTCDLSPEILSECDITLTPLYITSGDDEFRDGVDVKPADVFRMVDKENRTCKTAAVNVFDYQKVFEEYSSKYDEVIQICISRGFSICYQNAQLAAAEFPNVRVVDSRNLSSGSGYLVYDAAIMAKEGKSADEICKYLEENKAMMNCSFVIDRLDYLHKGGRCSGVALISTKILGIKPCIEVADGAMRVGKKYRGKFEKCLEVYVKERLADINNIDLKRVFITHPMCAPETVELARTAIKKHAEFETIIETQAGCTVSNHCGPNTLGIIFKQKTPYI
ncbi:MAG: DegV family protein [Oscillospiraceae bacterium]|jgi:DegV family protein with EDD domain|nr:DegV family protein [Oscillospiraceae bacterium]